eukprot:NODE_19_length_3432_cov_183.249187_g15_i0.p1 GENE.NODE_19_length_3432_cov_183.249187_g15_i0~~NODE_19_length_3432_cov_183.249187_g15_i0.p1  ORF type:complete len:1000 (-),score=208.09 NODE_19_length_3432_cov_183.249187_g15_i0:431-3070(-)
MSVALYQAYQNVQRLMEAPASPISDAASFSSSSSSSFKGIMAYLTLIIRFHRRVLLTVDDAAMEQQQHDDALNASCLEILNQKNEAVDLYQRECASAKQQMERAKKELDRLRSLVANNEEANTGPTGNISLVFTDVQNSTKLWEQHPEDMRQALRLHNAVMREEIALHDGFEVKTEGDAFLVAFNTTQDALHWCLAAQRRLLTCDWPRKLLTDPDADVVHDNEGKVLYCGLRVRMGFNSGTPEHQIDPITRRTDYFGNVVNMCARICGVATGGQIAVGAAGTQDLQQRNALLPDDVHTHKLGPCPLRGISKPEEICLLTPKELQGRHELFRAKRGGEGSQLANSSPVLPPLSLGPSAEASEVEELKKLVKQLRADNESLRSLLQLSVSTPRMTPRVLAPSTSPRERERELCRKSSVLTSLWKEMEGMLNESVNPASLPKEALQLSPYTQKKVLAWCEEARESLANSSTPKRNTNPQLQPSKTEIHLKMSPGVGSKPEIMRQRSCSDPKHSGKSEAEKVKRKARGKEKIKETQQETEKGTDKKDTVPPSAKEVTRSKSDEIGKGKNKEWSKESEESHQRRAQHHRHDTTTTTTTPEEQTISSKDKQSTTQRKNSSPHTHSNRTNSDHSPAPHKRRPNVTLEMTGFGGDSPTSRGHGTVAGRRPPMLDCSSSGGIRTSSPAIQALRSNASSRESSPRVPSEGLKRRSWVASIGSSEDSDAATGSPALSFSLPPGRMPALEGLDHLTDLKADGGRINSPKLVMRVRSQTTPPQSDSPTASSVSAGAGAGAGEQPGTRVSPTVTKLRNARGNALVESLPVPSPKALNRPQQLTLASMLRRPLDRREDAEDCEELVVCTPGGRSEPGSLLPGRHNTPIINSFGN